MPKLSIVFGARRAGKTTLIQNLGLDPALELYGGPLTEEDTATINQADEIDLYVLGDYKAERIMGLLQGKKVNIK